MAEEAAHSQRQSAEDRLIDAAERVVIEVGAGHLTLEAVARAAGVSKGGLLYHFPSKEALLQGMIDRHLRDIDARVAGLGGDSRSPAELVRRRVRALLELDPQRRAIGAALIAACAVNPALMSSLRGRFREFADELAQFPGGFEKAAIVLLAVDGLLLGELLHVSPYTPAERERIVAALCEASESCLSLQCAT